jgi:hypothetical protein
VQEATSVDVRGLRRVLSFERSSVRTLAAGATLVVALVLVFGSILFKIGTSAPRFNDATLTIRLYDVMERAGSTPFTSRRDPANGAPDGMPLLPAAQIAAPIQPGFVWASKDVLGFVGAVNVFLYAGLLLTGLAMFRLLDSLSFGFLPSLFGALLTTFNPWMYERVVSGHVAFAHGWVLILLLFALLRVRRSRTLSSAALAGGAYGLCFLMASYFGLLATALVVGFAIVDVASVRSWAERLWTCSLLAVTGGVMLLALAPGALVLLLDRSAVVGTLTRELSQLDFFSASPTDYLLPAPNHPLVGGVAEDLRRYDPFREKVLFFGYVTMLLAGATVVCLVRSGRQALGSPRRELLWLSVAAGGVALIGSLGRKLDLWLVEIPLPAYLVAEVTTFYRVYARLGFIVGLALAILAAAALSRIGHRRYGTAMAAVLALLVVMEVTPQRADAVRIDRAPAYDEWLARQPRGIVAHYPMMTDRAPAEQLAARELYYQRFTGLELFEIYGPERYGTREDAIRLLVRYPNDSLSPGILAAEGVRYVVLHDDVYRLQKERIPRLKRDYFEFLRRFGNVRIYRVRATPVDVDAELVRNAAKLGELFRLQPPEVRLGSGFYGSETYLDYGGDWRWMKQDGVLRVHNRSDRPVGAVIQGMSFSNGVLRRVEVTNAQGRVLARTLVDTFLADFKLGPFTVPPGKSVFRLSTQPGPSPFGGGDTRLASIYVSPIKVRPLADFTKSLRER